MLCSSLVKPGLWMEMILKENCIALCRDRDCFVINFSYTERIMKGNCIALCRDRDCYCIIAICGDEKIVLLPL
jgi:hypothetical protein